MAAPHTPDRCRSREDTVERLASWPSRVCSTGNPAQRKARSRVGMVFSKGWKRAALDGLSVPRYPVAERKSYCMSIISRAVVDGERVASWGQG
jgi:hypothetical protein